MSLFVYVNKYWIFKNSLFFLSVLIFIYSFIFGQGLNLPRLVSCYVAEADFKILMLLIPHPHSVRLTGVCHYAWVKYSIFMVPFKDSGANSATGAIPGYQVISKAASNPVMCVCPCVHIGSGLCVGHSGTCTWR